ncbi:hypothetical protein CFK38_16855 [Brachybacterium vulturis]|uniref:Uncharacterized protein n=1 Tax=Brachybacterium vulturis TaxID=2017484 RepID=A0A291GSA4_9MICO|nr:hypothetical protein [Brachybacterium vulturis]ATG53000.1 hypothetical protein CFK38_16855 [Brachybacterium vulturis]
MRAGEHLPDDQAELVLSTQVEEWIAENVDHSQWDEVLDDIVDLFTRPWGKHPLSNRSATDQLAGLNTTATLRGEYRLVFRSSISPDGTGLLEIIAIGPRSENRIYDAVNALIASGTLDEDVVQSIWDMLELYELTAQKHGLELWDYRPEPPPDGLMKSAVAIGALTQEIAEVLSIDELNAAIANAWDPDTGQLDPPRALAAALERVAGSPDPERLIALREEPRCGAAMPRAKAPCIRRRGHAGAHRATL